MIRTTAKDSFQHRIELDVLASRTGANGLDLKLHQVEFQAVYNKTTETQNDSKTSLEALRAQLEARNA